MGKNKKNENKVQGVEFHIWMHCNACERTVAKAISKIKGVEKFTTDMIKHRVIITGLIDPEKVMKKLKKKTGKRVEIIRKKDEEKVKSTKEEKGEGDLISEQIEKQVLLDTLLSDFGGDIEIYTLFSDENANACSIM